MTKLLRAILFSAVATVLAVVTANVISGRRWSLVGRSLRSREDETDEEGLTGEQRDLLMDELNAQL